MTTDDGLGIPDELRVANRKPLTPEQENRLAEVQTEARVDKNVDWDKPKGMDAAEWEKVKADRAAEKAKKTEDRIAKLRASKGLDPRPKGQPVPKRKDQLPLPPRKGAALPTPQAPRPQKPSAATTLAKTTQNAPTGSAGAAPQHQETTVTKKTNNAKKTAAAAAKAVKGKLRPQKAKGASAPTNGGGARPGTKLELVVGLLKRPQGCTTADILAATGWPAVSVPGQAKAAGLTLTKEKVKGQNTIYRAT